MFQPSKTIRIRRRMSLFVLVLTGLGGAAVSPLADDAVAHAVRFRTAMFDSAHTPVAPAQLLFAGMPPLA